MAIYKTARFRVKPEGLETCRAAIREFVAQIKAQEPGTRLYVSLEDRERPGEFVHVMMFTDAAAEQRHRATEWVKRFTGILYPHTMDGVQFTDYAEVAST
jgi:quinol monooxygenase YgiN